MNNTYTSQPQFAPVIRPCHSACIFQFVTVRRLSGQGDAIFTSSFSVYFVFSYLLLLVLCTLFCLFFIFFVCGRVWKELSGVNLAGDTPDLASATSKQPWQSKATKLITGCVFVFELKGLHTLSGELNSVTNTVCARGATLWTTAGLVACFKADSLKGCWQNTWRRSY